MKIRKSEAGGYVLNVSEVNILKHIEQIFNEIKPLAVIKNVKISLNTTEADIIGWYDRELVEIIFLNIISNAVKYSNAGGNVNIKLTIIHTDLDGTTDDRLDRKQYLIGEIVDNGIGIPADEITKVLQPFYRAENTRNGLLEFKGDGIGLNLVSRLIKIHHGLIDIDSKTNEFTVVTIKIPIAKEDYNIKELKPNILHTPIVVDETEHKKGRCCAKQ